MKPRIHPDSRSVVFRDRAADVAFLTRSTADSAKTIEWEDGRTYPVIDVEISSASATLLHGQHAGRGHRGPSGALRAPLRPCRHA